MIPSHKIPRTGGPAGAESRRLGARAGEVGAASPREPGNISAPGGGGGWSGGTNP